MTAAQIVQLFIVLGPAALDLIHSLLEVWNKPELSLEEVKAILEKTKKSYDDYINQA